MRAFKANPWGLHDMAGNVWQWCGDWYDKDYTKTSNLTNPSGPKSGEYRVLRGGSWYDINPAHFCASYQYRNDPAFRRDNNGFRCVSQD